MRELSVAEQRYQAVLAVISDGLSISQVASKVRVSRQTLHSWGHHTSNGAVQALRAVAMSSANGATAPMICATKSSGTPATDRLSVRWPATKLKWWTVMPRP